MQDVREYITRAFLRSGLTQGAFADSINVPRETLNKTLNGNRIPKQRVLKTFRDGLRSLSELRALTPEETQLLDFLDPRNRVWRGRGVGLKILYVSFWGDSAVLGDCQMGAQSLANLFGSDFEYVGCDGDARKFADCIDDAIKRQVCLIIEVPPCYKPPDETAAEDDDEEDEPDMASKAITRAIEAYMAPASCPSSLSSLVVTGGPRPAEGVAVVHERFGAVGALIAAQADLLAKAHTVHILPIHSADTAVVVERYKGLETSMSAYNHTRRTCKPPLREIRLIRVPPISPKLSAPTPNQITNLISSYAQRVNGDILLVASLFFSASDTIVREQLESLPSNVRLITTDFVDGWIRPMRSKSAAHWIATVAFDARLMGALAIVLAERMSRIKSGQLVSQGGHCIELDLELIEPRLVPKSGSNDVFRAAVFKEFYDGVAWDFPDIAEARRYISPTTIPFV